MTPPANFTDPDTALQAGVRAHEQGDLRQAEDCYRQALALDGRNADALNLLGLVALQRGDAAAAVELIGQSVAENDRNPDTHANLGTALMHLGRAPDALAAFNRALQIDSGHVDAHYNCGQLMFELGEFEQAAKAFSTVVGLQPDRAEAAVKLGVALMQGGQEDEGVETLRRAAALAPEDDSVRFNLAVALIQARRLDEAEQELGLIGGDAARAPETLFAYGQLEEARGRPAEAADYFRAVFASDPDHAAAHFSLAKQMVDLGQLPEAERHMRRCVELQPGAPDTRCNLGVILDALGRHDEAVECFRGAGEIGLVCLAESHLRRGEAELAAAVAGELEAANPDHPDIASLRSRIGS